MVLYILQYLLYAGIGREAAVHRQTDAGDETGCIIVQQKQQCAHKVFFAVAKVAHGGGGKDLFGAVGGGAVLVEEQLCVLLAGKKARGNGVDLDAHFDVNTKKQVEFKKFNLLGGCGGRI